MEFACTKLAPERVIRCAFGLTKNEFEIFLFFCSKSQELTSKEIQKQFDGNLASIQRALKKLTDTDLIKRQQMNLEGGGYEYYYTVRSRTHLRKLLTQRLSYWVGSIEKEVKEWTRKTI